MLCIYKNLLKLAIRYKDNRLTGTRRQTANNFRIKVHQSKMANAEKCSNRRKGSLNFKLPLKYPKQT